LVEGDHRAPRGDAPDPPCGRTLRGSGREINADSLGGERSREESGSGGGGAATERVSAHRDCDRCLDRFVVESAAPYFEANDTGSVVDHRLTEIEAGLFLADNGETLDLRGTPPTWRNLELIRVTGGPAPLQSALLGSVALVAVFWLVAGLVSTLRRRRSRLANSGAPPATRRGWRLVIAFVATFTAVLTLGTIAFVAAVPRLVDSGFLGWLELPLALRLVAHLPLVLAVLTGCLVILLAFGVARHSWSRASRRRDVALTLASLALIGQLAAWHLIGWGLS
jgi:hypothetical protein